jgi:hypothetical protein
VVDLFSKGPTDKEILSHYPWVEIASSEIRSAATSGISLEKFLREQYRDSSHEHDRRVFFQVPLYLQHRLMTASRTRQTGVPDHYDALLMRARRLDDVVFVTLNYDLLLDQRLRGLDTLKSYIAKGQYRERGWSLIKLHGSVNWVRALVEGSDVAVDPPYYSESFDRFALSGNTPLSPEIEFRALDPRASEETTLARTRASGNQALFYPALSVPLGGANAKPSCPADHLDFLEERLREAGGLHLLFLGFSGYDADVLQMIRASDTDIRSVTTVDPDADAHRRILEGLGSYPHERSGHVVKAFSDFISSGGFSDGFRAVRLAAPAPGTTASGSPRSSSSRCT